MPYYLKLKKNNQRVSKISLITLENYLEALVTSDGSPALSCNLHPEFGPQVLV